MKLDRLRIIAFGLTWLPTIGYTTPTCLDEAQRAAYIVAPQKPQLRSPSGSEQEILATPLAQLDEEDILQSLAEFLEKRAQAELQAWVLDDVLTRLCASGNALFPDTCQMNRVSKGSYADIANNYDALITVLRNDFENIPACVLQHYTGNTLPYYFQSIYQQSQLGNPFDELLYGLADMPDFYQTCTLTNGQPNRSCQIVLPVLLYASGMDVSAQGAVYRDFIQQLADIRQDKVDEAKDADATKLLFAQYGDKIQAARGELEQWSSKQFDDFMESLQQRLQNVDPAMAQALAIRQQLTEQKVQSFIARLSNLAALARQTRKEIEDRQDAAQQYLTETSLGLNALMLAAHQLPMQQAGDNASALSLIQAGLQTQSFIEAREYTEANIQLVNIGQQLAQLNNCNNDENPTPSCTLIDNINRLTKVSGVVATLAEAKDQNDFQQKMAALSSPIGSWKRRYEGSFTSINGFFGLSYQHARYNSTAFAAEEGDETAAFAPLGIQKTWTNGQFAWGAFLSLLDLGPLIKAPKAFSVDGGVVSSDVEASLDTAFSPGLFFTLSHRSAPITLGIGYSEGPNGYRTFEDAQGNTWDVDRERTVSAFIAVDLALFPL